MPEPLRISLRYRGRGVDDGTMPIEDVAEALDGFSGAYGKIASQISPETTYILRVTGVRTQSFDLLIAASIALSQYGDQFKAAELVIDAAKHIFTLLSDVIKVKKHVKGHPYTLSVKGDHNTVTVINADKVEFATTQAAVEVLKAKTIDSDLNKIAEPLQMGTVDAVEVKAEDGAGKIETTITSEEREYFRPTPSEALTKDAEVVGTFVSLNKERNRGSFRLKNNRRVPYRYVGENREDFHEIFGVYEGPVRAWATAEFNENLEPTRLDIKTVEPLQATLELPPSPEGSE
jgi:hypothetical protein